MRLIVLVSESECLGPWFVVSEMIIIFFLYQMLIVLLAIGIEPATFSTFPSFLTTQPNLYLHEMIIILVFDHDYDDDDEYEYDYDDDDEYEYEHDYDDEFRPT